MKKILLLVLSALCMVFATSCEDKNKITDPTLAISPDTPIVFTDAGGSKVITVQTNLPTWNVISSQEWCVVSRAADGKSFSVTANKYLEKAPQPEATVTVSATNGTVTKTVTLSVKQTGVDAVPFEILISDITASGAKMAVTATDKNSRYYYDVITKESLAANHSGDLAVYMVNMVAQAVENTEGDLEAALEIICTVGDEEHTYSSLLKDRDYIAFAVGLGDDGKVSTLIVQSEFKTLDNAVDMTFAVSGVKTYYDGFDYTITPSNLEERYYQTYRPVAQYKGWSDEAILAQILIEDGMMIDWLAKTGVYVYENEGVGNTGTTHFVLAFGWKGGAPSTPLAKFEIKTTSVDIPAGASFSMVPSDITSRSANVDITPTVDKAMYLWDLMDEELYNEYKGNLTELAEEYAELLGARYDGTLSRGEDRSNYTKMLTPSTTYYVWAAYMDENGKVMGDVVLMKPFTTAAAEVSAAVVTSSVEKYFNGDDLYAKDPIKYQKAQGMAYVPVKFIQNKECKVWYADMFAEDPTYPTSAMSDAEIASSLEAGMGKWCNVGAIYYCKWDADHIALAVGIAADDNYGPVLRTKYVFTKDKAAPISEFVDPSATSASSNVAQKMVKAKSELQKIYKTPTSKKK